MRKALLSVTILLWGASALWAGDFAPVKVMGVFYKTMDVTIEQSGGLGSTGTATTWPTVAGYGYLSEFYAKIDYDFLSLVRNSPKSSSSPLLAEDGWLLVLPKVTMGMMWTDWGWLGLGAGLELGQSRYLEVTNSGNSKADYHSTQDVGLNLVAVFNLSPIEGLVLATIPSYTIGKSFHTGQKSLGDAAYGTAEVTFVATLPMVGVFYTVGKERHELPSLGPRVTASQYVKIGVSFPFLFSDN